MAARSILPDCRDKVTDPGESIGCVLDMAENDESQVRRDLDSGTRPSSYRPCPSLWTYLNCNLMQA